MFDFLRAIGLHPIDWSEAVKLTGKGSPYIGEILDAAFAEAQAIVVLMTPDEIAYLREEYKSHQDDPEAVPAAQPPNVLFEAGMGLGRSPDRTILVELGAMRGFSDVAGRHVVRMTGSTDDRKELARRLETSGCAVNLEGEKWETEGNLTPPPAPAAGEPIRTQETPVEVAAPPPTSIVIKARYADRGGGRARLYFTNQSGIRHDFRFNLPPEAGNSFYVAAEQPVEIFPDGETIGFVAARSFGTGSDHFEIPITARTPDGEAVSTKAFVSLVG